MQSKTIGLALVLLWVVGLGIVANAQIKPQTAKKTPIAKAATAQSIPPPLEAKAIDLLKATSLRLAAANTLSFAAVEIFEHPSRHGDPLAYATRYEVKLERPDKLRVMIAGDGPKSEFYYNGKTMMAYAPAENLLAVADAPPTIDAMLEAAYHSNGTYFPFTDLIVADPYRDMAPGLKLAYYIGQSHVVGETTTDMIAYVGDGVFAEVWIGVEDKLPRLIHAVYLDDPEQLRHNLLLSDWRIDLALPADAFTSSSAANAKRIQFAHPHPQPRPGIPLPAKGAPSPTP